MTKNTHKCPQTGCSFEDMEKEKEIFKNNKMRNLSDSTETKVKAGAIPAELFKSYDELDKANKIAAIKANDYTLYSILFQEKFKKWPPDAAEKTDHNVKRIYQDALRSYTKDTLSKMSWDELTKANKTILLKELDPEAYKKIFFKRFGKYPQF